MQANISDDWMDSTLWLESANRGISAAHLYIKIKVGFEFAPAQVRTWTDSNNRQQSTQTLDWDAPSMFNWKRDLKSTVESGWNDKLHLEPQSEWHDFARSHALASHCAPPIILRLVIQPVPRAHAHVIIRSFRVAPGGFSRSFMSAPYFPSSRRHSLDGNEVVGELDTEDLVPKSSGQIAALHEFGHYIGLNHDQAPGLARSRWNSQAAYGPTDLMGGGTEINPWHAYPWCRRLRRHLGGPQPSSVSWSNAGNPLTWQTGTGDQAVDWLPKRGRPRILLLEETRPTAADRRRLQSPTTMRARPRPQDTPAPSLEFE